MTENQKIPNLLKDKFDLRSLTINSFFEVIDMIKNGEVEDISIGSNTKVVCYTSFGTVSGTPLSLTNQENVQHKNVSFLHDTIMQVRNKQVDYFESNGFHQMSNHSGYIAFIDAELTYYAAPGRKDNLAYFLLYPDQIIGLSFGEFSK